MKNLFLSKSVSSYYLRQETLSHIYKLFLHRNRSFPEIIRNKLSRNIAHEINICKDSSRLWQR